MIDGFPEDMKFCFVKDNVSQETFNELLQEWDRKGGSKDQFSEFSMAELNSLNSNKLMQFTHIISEETFDSFDAIVYQRYVPIVTSKWLQKSLETCKIQPVRNYTPDPKMIFKGKHFVIGDKCNEWERKLIKSLIWTYGGDVFEDLKSQCNYYIKMDDLDANISVIEEFNERGRGTIEIIELKWVFSQIAVKGESELQNVSVKFDEDGLNEDLITGLKSIIHNMGGKIGDNELLITEYYNEKEGHLDQFTCDYLFQVAMLGKIEHHSLLHEPPQANGVRGMEKVVVGTTNYTGDSRKYIEELVERMGGGFAKTLKRGVNTHLVAANAIGKKCQFGQKWGVAIINHCWIEDCFRQWSIVDANDAKYTKLIRGDGGDQVRVIDSLEISKRVAKRTPSPALDASLEARGKSKSGTPRADFTEEETEDSKRSVGEDSSEQRPVKKAKKTKADKKEQITAILTGVDVVLSGKDKKALRAAGINIVENPEHKKLNCIISPTLLRTEKFLKAMSRNPRWYLHDGVIRDALRGSDVSKDWETYNVWNMIKDKEELQSKGLFTKMGLAEARQAMERSKSLLFDGIEFVCDSDVKRSIIKMFGGRIGKGEPSSELGWDAVVDMLFQGRLLGLQAGDLVLVN